MVVESEWVQLARLEEGTCFGQRPGTASEFGGIDGFGAANIGKGVGPQKLGVRVRTS